MIVELVDEAVERGARFEAACATIGIAARTLQRWRGAADGLGADGRRGPNRAPKNKIGSGERAIIMTEVNSAPYRNLTPKQIVPLLADRGVYLCSESTMYRFLRQDEQLGHRGRQRPATRSKPAEKVATCANQVWCWDISYLPTRVRGLFYYLYMVEDVFSRKIVGWRVEAEESMEQSAALLERCHAAEGVTHDQLILHADNGGPMKGSTMLASLKRLGVMASFSRPAVSNDNPFIESLFRTVKYCPAYPYKGFESIEAARRWFETFVNWYNNEHLHSAIGYVTPASRHEGFDREVLARREAVYQQARQKNPERWSGETRNWERIDEVRLNRN
jgi:putative transposase